MDLKEIEKLMALMNKQGMGRVLIKEKGFELEVEREGAPVSFQAAPRASAAVPSQEVKQEGGNYITSPMVGTFYSSPSPEDPPFVKVGDAVDEGSVVCIVEAMKVMNEVKADAKGSVTEILVKNGDPVEFGTKIFKIG